MMPDTDMVAASMFSAINNNDLLPLHEVLMENPEFDLNQPVYGSMTALHVAAEKGYSSCVKVLLSSGAGKDVEDESGYTPLMTGINANYPMVVIKLLEAKCDCNKTTKSKMTPLHLACRHGSPGIIQMLLMAKADPTVWNSDGETPLSIALQNSFTQVIQVLLFGCTYMDPNLLARTVSLPQPALFSLRKAKFTLCKTLFLGGYPGRDELRIYFNQLPDDLEIKTEDEVKSFRILQDCLSSPWPLAHACRLVVRKSLNFNIQTKVSQLCLPQALRDYTCFRDVYTPVDLYTNSDLYTCFSDHSRDMYCELY